MASLMKSRKKALAMGPQPPVIHPADRLSKLPEEILAHILTFLPAQETVRTCVLARTWRHVWKFSRRLLITGNSVQEVTKFVYRLLHVRRDGLQLASLHAAEIRFDPFFELDYYEEACLSWVDTSRLNTWIRRVLDCQIQMLRVDISAPYHRKDIGAYLKINNMFLLVSRHLTRLEVTGVRFACQWLRFDGCPALEHLEINECCLAGVRKMTSLSLKRLVMTSCQCNGDRNRIHISVPRLVSLWLDDWINIRTPVLERMPELVAAKVHIGSCMDHCSCKDPTACHHVMRAGDTSDTDFDSNENEVGSGHYAGKNATKCVVLEGLAEVKDLVLKFHHSTYTFRRDLRWCPTFSKLKTLVLIEVYWRDPPADCSALACMLEHAPLLEKLTLILDKILQRGGKCKVEMKGYLDVNVKSTKISQHLQIVKIKSEGVNERFLNVLNFLGTLNISFKTRANKYMP